MHTKVLSSSFYYLHSVPFSTPFVLSAPVSCVHLVPVYTLAALIAQLTQFHTIRAPDSPNNGHHNQIANASMLPKTFLSIVNVFYDVVTPCTSIPVSYHSLGSFFVLFLSSLAACSPSLVPIKMESRANAI